MDIQKHIATFQTYCSGSTGANNMSESMKGHNGAWGGNVDTTPLTTKGWGSSEPTGVVCCVCKEKIANLQK